MPQSPGMSPVVTNVTWAAASTLSSASSVQVAANSIISLDLSKSHSSSIVVTTNSTAYTTCNPLLDPAHTTLIHVDSGSYVNIPFSAAYANKVVFLFDADSVGCQKGYTAKVQVLAAAPAMASSTSTSGLSTGVLIAIIVGVVVLVILIGLAVWKLVQRKSQHEATKKQVEIANKI